jgi:L-iditol 2-dehydrogenase
MKAVVKTSEGRGNVTWIDVPLPEPKEGEVRVRVEAAGICGTDCKIYSGDAWSNPPVVLGHEYSGVIDALGSGVDGVRVGERVVSETAQVVCGDCEYCRTGRSLMCKDRLSIGYGVDGAFARYITVRKALIHKIPDHVSFEIAALCEPFAVALHGVWDNAEILPTHTVLVSGPGAIGMLAAIAAKSKGATVILAGVESDAERLEIAKEIGIDHVTDRLDADMLRTLTGKPAVDAAIDCTGAAPAIDQALHLLKANGRLVQIGLTKSRIEIEYSLLTAKEIQICGVFGHRWHNWEQALCLLGSGKFDFSKIITNKHSLENWQDGFDEMIARKGLKVLLIPTD